MKKPSNEAMEVSVAVNAFLRDYAPKHKTGSENTLRSYETAIRMFLTYIGESEGVTTASLSWKCFSERCLEGWMGWLRDVRGNSPATCNVRLASLREFLRYAAGRDASLQLWYQGACSVNKFKCPSRKVEGLTKEATKALMAAPDTSTRTGRRDLALMFTMYATATRIGELLALRISDVRLEARRPCLNVVGKGGKTRTAYIPKKAAETLRGYVREFHGDNPDPLAFLFYSRRSDTHRPLTQQAVSDRLKLYASKASKGCPDVPLGLHAHQFRHARASHWLQGGMNIVEISFLLGHANLQTTMVYLDITTEDELKALEVLESDQDKKVAPKWNGADGGLLGFCGL